MLWNRVRSWISNPRRLVPNRPVRPCRRRLILEGLEERWCPSNIIITTQPHNQIVAVNSTVALSAAAIGNPAPTVQWQESTNGGESYTTIAGATSDTYSFTAPSTPSTELFQAVFTNTSGSKDTRAAQITVDAPPAVTTNPTSETVDVGGTATFTAAASGTPAPTVQWQVSHDGGKDFSNIALANQDTFTFAAKVSENGDEFRALFRNPVGAAVSTVADLTVDYAPSITEQPKSQNVAPGSTVTLDAAAKGNPAPTVQWETSSDGGKTYTPISGATSDSYTFTAPTTAGTSALYRAVFTNDLGVATTAAARITAVVAPVVTTNPVSQEVHAGTTVTFTAAATGMPTPHVQWQISTDKGKTFSNIPLANTDSLTFTARPSENNDEFRAVFTNAGGSATTTAATLTVDYGPILPPPPNDQTVATGSQVTLTVTAQGNPLPTVQWQISTDGGKTYTNIPGATSYTYVLTAPSTPGVEYFDAVLTNSSGSVTTPPYKVTIDAPPVVTQDPVSQTVNAGTTVTFTAAATGTPAPHVQWQISTDGGKDFRNIPLANTDTLTFKTNAGMNGDEYRAVFHNPVGEADTTAATLNVHFAPSITEQPKGGPVAVGSQVTLDATANANPAPTIQWQVSNDGGLTFSNIAGATSDAYTFTAPLLPASAVYRAVFTNALGHATTHGATLNFEVPPAVTINPISETVVAGGTATFTAAGSGTPAPRVEWQISKDGTHWSTLSFADTNTLTFTAEPSMNSEHFRAVFINPVGQAISAVATLTVTGSTAT
jgi:Immunoglobulin I-set domain